MKGMMRTYIRMRGSTREEELSGRLQLRTNTSWHVSVRAAYVCLYVLDDDGSVWLWRLNGRGARGFHHPSNSA